MSKCATSSTHELSRLELIEQLLRAGLSPHYVHNSLMPVEVAIVRDWKRIAEYLLLQVRYSELQCSRIWTTVIKHDKLEWLLFLRQINFPAMRADSLLTACASTGEAVFRYLLAHGGEGLDPRAVNSSGMSCLHLACQGNRATLVRQLLSQQLCDLNQPDSRARVPLVYAHMQNSLSVLKLLIDHGTVLERPKWSRLSSSPTSSDVYVALH